MEDPVMNLRVHAGLATAVINLAFLAPPASAQEVFWACPSEGYCAAITVNGEFYSGDPHVTNPGDPFKRRRNVMDGAYPASDRPGIRIAAFWCTGSEWCIALDNKGGVYAGTARPSSTQQDDFKKR
jgi:hypothetical protein